MPRKKAAPRAKSRKKAPKTASVRRKKTPVRRKSLASAPPKPPADAELIVRQGFVIDATGKGHSAVPEVLILGNRAGLTYLSELFAHLAERAKSRSRTAEPDTPLHLGGNDHPVNPRLSDALEFRFAALTDGNRAATLKQHGVTMKSREKGSLFGRYQEVAETQYTKVARQIQK